MQERKVNRNEWARRTWERIQMRRIHVDNEEREDDRRKLLYFWIKQQITSEDLKQSITENLPFNQITLWERRETIRRVLANKVSVSVTRTRGITSFRNMLQNRTKGQNSEPSNPRATKLSISSSDKGWKGCAVSNNKGEEPSSIFVNNCQISDVRNSTTTKERHCLSETAPILSTEHKNRSNCEIKDLWYKTATKERDCLSWRNGR